MDDDSRSELTASGQTLGTPSYMSPEQAKQQALMAQAEADTAHDAETKSRRVAKESLVKVERALYEADEQMMGERTADDAWYVPAEDQVVTYTDLQIFVDAKILLQEARETLRDVPQDDSTATDGPDEAEAASDDTTDNAPPGESTKR